MKKSFIIETAADIDAIEIQSMLNSMDIDNKTRLLDKNFRHQLNKLTDYMGPDECRHYEETHDDVTTDASRIPLSKLDKTHIYYSIRYLREVIKSG